MDKVILSFLGTGNYAPADYPLDGEIYTTRYTQEALWCHYNDEGYTLKVLLTKEAEEKHGQELGKWVAYESIPIPSGRTEEELWQIFDAIVQAVPEEAELIMDVSHGFRSQPILALSVLQFLGVVKKVRVRRILHGFYDPDTKKAYFFDLTGFLTLVEWTQATRDLLEHGGGARLGKLLRDIHSSSYRVEGPKAKKLSSVGETLDKVEKALSLLRLKEALSSVKKLIKHLEAASEDVALLPRSKPFGLLLEEIRKRYQPLATENLFDSEGLRAQGEMMELLLKTQRYAQALTLVRELLVTLACLQQGWEPDPDEEKGEEGRKSAEGWLNINGTRGEKRDDMDPRALPLISLWKRTADLRNDVAHASMRENPTGTIRLVDAVKEVCAEAQKLLEDHLSREEAGRN